MSVALEIRKDIIGERLYASRNSSDLEHTYKASGANRAQLDWNLTLRQVRRKEVQKKVHGSTSLPNLRTAEIGPKREVPLAPEHPDGRYHSSTQTVGRYQNFGDTSHMLTGLARVSSSSAHGIDWQLNLRDGYHQKPDEKWRRHFTRQQPSFDVMQANCGPGNENYKKSKITPQDRRPDRRQGAISIESIRDDPISFHRLPGCEGAQAGLWEHLLSDRRYGPKARRQIQHESTMREMPGDPNGARITDNRNDGCIVEMLGKKRWVGHKSHEPLAARPPLGDPRLHYLSQMRPLPEADEENRRLRKSKQPRTDGESTSTSREVNSDA
mmetsp:Transcript_47960/g.104338  ORF Transcript_47960/g.104338 Transcript_47960/m.104338 type:complete len:326 (-) Transcript_47960:137-1114(-)